MWGLGCRVQGLGFGVWGLGVWVEGCGCGVQGFRLRVWGVGFDRKPHLGLGDRV